MRWFIVFFIALFPGACGGPCKTLAQKICSCQKTQKARQSCEQSLDVLGQHKSFSLAENSARCQAALKDPKCTCASIESNQFEACGLTRP